MLEKERKFLVCGPFRHLADKKLNIKQAFLNSDPKRSVRVRLISDKAFLTIKGKLQKDGLSRLEVEFEVSFPEAEQLMMIAESAPIEKTRYIIPYQNLCIEVDEFHGNNEGLIMAEIEIKENEKLGVLPDWIGQEVSGDPKYYNAELSKMPFNTWSK